MYHARGQVPARPSCWPSHVPVPAGGGGSCRSDESRYFPKVLCFVWGARVPPSPSTNESHLTPPPTPHLRKSGLSVAGWLVMEMSACSYFLDRVTQLLKMRSSRSLPFSLSLLTNELRWMLVARNGPRGGCSPTFLLLHLAPPLASQADETRSRPRHSEISNQEHRRLRLKWGDQMSRFKWDIWSA